MKINLKREQILEIENNIERIIRILDDNPELKIINKFKFRTNMTCKSDDELYSLFCEISVPQPEEFITKCPNAENCNWIDREARVKIVLKSEKAHDDTLTIWLGNNSIYDILLSSIGEKKPHQFFNLKFHEENHSRIMKFILWNLMKYDFTMNVVHQRDNNDFNNYVRTVFNDGKYLKSLSFCRNRERGPAAEMVLKRFPKLYAAFGNSHNVVPNTTNDEQYSYVTEEILLERYKNKIVYK